MKALKQSIYYVLASVSRQAIDSAIDKGNGNCMWIVTYEPKMPKSILQKHQSLASLPLATPEE